MGFTVVAGASDASTLYEHGQDDPIYIARTLWLVALQVVSVGGATAIVLYQLRLLLAGKGKGKKCMLPKAFEGRLSTFMPSPVMNRKQRRAYIFRQLGDSTDKFQKTVQRFDGVEFARFDHILSTSMSTIQIVDARRIGRLTIGSAGVVRSFGRRGEIQVGRPLSQGSSRSEPDPLPAQSLIEAKSRNQELQKNHLDQQREIETLQRQVTNMKDDREAAQARVQELEQAAVDSEANAGEVAMRLRQLEAEKGHWGASLELLRGRIQQLEEQSIGRPQPQQQDDRTCEV